MNVLEKSNIEILSYFQYGDHAKPKLFQCKRVQQHIYN